MAPLNRKNACFSMLLLRLFSDFKCQNKPEYRSIASELHCELKASTLNSLVLEHFNIAEITVATF